LKKILTYFLEIFGLQCNLNWLDTSQITDMSELFMNWEFNGDISNWDVGNVTDMSRMFQCCKFNGDISNWNVSNVKLMYYMFDKSSFN
jgi:surface protein